MFQPICKDTITSFRNDKNNELCCFDIFACLLVRCSLRKKFISSRTLKITDSTGLIVAATTPELLQSSSVSANEL